MYKVMQDYKIRMLISIISILGIVLLIHIPVLASEQSTASEEAVSLDEPENKENIPDLIPEDSLNALLEQISVSPDSTYLEKPEGNAEVTDNTGDNIQEKHGKEFFTIKTKDEHIYYLVIDHDLATDNVYFLDQVTERDLAGMLPAAENSSEEPEENNTMPISVSPEAPAQKETIPEDTAEKPEAAGNEKNGGTNVIPFILLMAAVFGIGYYVKIYKPKKKVLDDALDFDEDFEPDSGTDYEETEEEDEGFLFREEEPEEEEIKIKRNPHTSRQETQHHTRKEPDKERKATEPGKGNILTNIMMFLVKIVFGSILIGLVSLGFTVLLNDNLKNIVLETLTNCFR